MSGVSPLSYHPTQQQLPTPSPFGSSVASTGWISQPSIQFSNLFLRFVVFLLSFISALSLTAPSFHKKKYEDSYGFDGYPELKYCFSVSILATLYAAFQLFKGVCDIAYRGFLISDKTSDYTSFILDQLTGYLLVSSSSVTISAIERIDSNKSLWKAAIVSVIASFVAFAAISACSLLSGYRLCKRIIW